MVTLEYTGHMFTILNLIEMDGIDNPYKGGTAVDLHPAYGETTAEGEWVEHAASRIEAAEDAMEWHNSTGLFKVVEDGS